MKIVIAAFCWAMLILAACSNEIDSNQKVLARVNDYEVYLDEFQTQLAEELEFEKDYKLTEEIKRQFLDEIIRRELLIQEAKRINLDRESGFVKTIERYWESTLIRNLIARKSEEINKRILVSEEEIKAKYNMMKKERGIDTPAFGSVRLAIQKKLQEQKKSEAMQVWLEELYQKANVEIATDMLTKN